MFKKLEQVGNGLKEWVDVREVGNCDKKLERRVGRSGKAMAGNGKRFTLLDVWEWRSHDLLFFPLLTAFTCCGTSTMWLSLLSLLSLLLLLSY